MKCYAWLIPLRLRVAQQIRIAGVPVTSPSLQKIAETTLGDGFHIIDLTVSDTNGCVKRKIQ